MSQAHVLPHLLQVGVGELPDEVVPDNVYQVVIVASGKHFPRTHT